MTLADLSMELPTDEDMANFHMLLATESDRGAAIMAGALVEKGLEEAIRARIANPGDEIVKSWFDGINAPFKSFASKIALGRSLAIYGDQMEARLSTVKNVRNVFAHRIPPLDFKHPTLIAECQKLATNPTWNAESDPLVVFVLSCLDLPETWDETQSSGEARKSKSRFPKVPHQHV